MEMLQKSITLDGSNNNFYAHSTKARINLTNYKRWLTQSECSPDEDPPDPCLLEDAKSDLEKSLSMSATPWDFSSLGEVYHLLAKLPTDKAKGSENRRKLLEKAMLYFTKAADCEDGKDQIVIHLVRGRCLFDMGEYVAAIGCFKQAITCEAKTSKFTGNFNELLQVYLCVLQQPVRDESILAEIAYNLKEAQLKYGRSNMETHCIGKMKVKYEAAMQVVTDYCKRFPEHNELVPLLLSTQKPLFSPPLPTGGTLEQYWTAPLQPFQDKDSVKSQSILSNLSHQTTGEYTPAAVKKDIETVITEDDTRLAEAAGSTERRQGNDESTRNPQGATSLEGPLQDLHITEPPNTFEVHENIRRAPDKTRVSGFEYDFYVVYPDSIKDWVVYTLLSELENMWKLKGCTRYTDALPGTYKLDEELKQMKDSASILLVIGRGFLANCEHMMHHALRLKKEPKRERVIIPVVVSDGETMPELLDRFNPFDTTRGKWKTLATCIEQQIKPVLQ